MLTNEIMPIVLKFEDLEIWKQARVLSLQIFGFTQRESFAKEYKFKDQIKSSAWSIMDNIAEGFERASRLEFVNFLGIAKGSVERLNISCTVLWIKSLLPIGV